MLKDSAGSGKCCQRPNPAWWPQRSHRYYRGKGVYSRLKYESGGIACSAFRQPNSKPRAHLSRYVPCCRKPKTSTSRLKPKIYASIVLFVGPRRPVGQHNLLCRAHHSPADKHRGQLPGRKIADSRTARKACACCAPVYTRQEWKGSSRLWQGTQSAGRQWRPQRKKNSNLQFSAETA